MNIYNLPNPNCKVCGGHHVNVYSVPVSRLEACLDCGSTPYPENMNVKAQMDLEGNVLPIHLTQQEPKPKTGLKKLRANTEGD